MICHNCKKEIADDSVFCEFCGTKQQPVQATPVQPVQATPVQPQQVAPQQQVNMGQPVQPQQGMPQQQMQPMKPPMSKKQKITLFSCIGAAVLVALIALILVVTHKHKINLADYTDVKFDGYDTCGKADIDFDYEKFFKELSKNAKKSKGTMSSSQKQAIKELFGSEIDDSYYDLYKDLDFKLSKKKNLKNGEKIELTFEFDNENAKKYGIKFIGEPKEFKVSGLKKIKEIDPFADAKISFSGTSPSAYAEVSNESTEEALSFVHYKLNKSSGIAKGDKIIVQAEYNENDVLELYGVKFTTKTKEYTCDSVDAYALKVSEIPEQALNTMKQAAENEIKEYFKDDKDYYSISDLKYEGCYLLSSKEYGSNSGYTIYSATLKSKKKWFKPSKVYYPVSFNDVVIKADGTSEVDVDYAHVYGSSKLGKYYVKGYVKPSEMYKKLTDSYSDRYNIDATEGLK